MQLTCPACGARYEIDDALIPSGGRRVQCSACDHVWHVEAPGHADAAPDEAGAEASPRPTPPPEASDADSAPSRRPPLAEEVKAILRQEAAHETRARRERGLIEIQPELGLAPGAAAGAKRRRPADGLPDPDKINETLRAASLRAAELHGAGRERPARGGFLVGLVVGLCVVGLAAALYVTAPRVADAVPEAGPALDTYVDLVDDLRVSLDTGVSRAMTALSDLVNAGG